MWAALAAAALLWVYWGTLTSYVRDQHYQEHFLYLWVFLGLALLRTVRGPFRRGFGLTRTRDGVGLALVLASWLAFAAFELGGSNVVGRTSMVLGLTGVTVLALPSWNVRRCLMHGLLMQLCFGLPYSVYFPITGKLQFGVAQCLALLPKLGLASYEVVDTVVVFPHYRLTITADCSGFGHVLTFLGIAALGILSAARNRKRTLLLLVAAVTLAWISNLARVGMFVAFVACGATWTVDDATWHAVLGFVAFLPFVTVLVGGILRTHVPWQGAAVDVVPPGRTPIAWLVVPLVALHLWLGERSAGQHGEPEYWTRLASPPGYALAQRGWSEAADRQAYDTPWLLNARFAKAADERYFDLFHYATRSRSHLNVHCIADCLGGFSVGATYLPPIQVDGRSWWRIRLGGAQPVHVYFAFEVAGERYDDSYATQLAVLRQRLFGGSWEVRLTRVMFPGPMADEPTAEELEVLRWLGDVTGGKGA